MSDLPGANDAIAILCSDTHFSHRPPRARSVEEDWYGVQKRYIDQLVKIAGNGKLPIIIAGDLFDDWDVPHELVNWALDSLPIVYAVPGQHELPNHRYRDIKRSAYWTLVQAGIIKNISPGKPFYLDNVVLWGFPWGFDVTPCRAGEPFHGVHLAVIHSYVWTKATGYPNAPKGHRLASWSKKLEGYHAAVFGDNHKGFLKKLGGCWVLNSGTFMRRHSDEREYEPSVGVLYGDGHVRRQKLDVSTDKFANVIDDSKKEQEQDWSKLVEQLSSLKEVVLDFTDVVVRWLESNEVPQAVKDILLSYIGEVRKKQRKSKRKVKEA